MVVWTLLDTGLRVGEFSSLSRDNIDWQAHRLMIYGKGGPYGTKSKRRIIPLTARVQPLIEGHFALHDAFGMGDRTIQRIVKRVANLAHISRPVTLRPVCRSAPRRASLPEPGRKRDQRGKARCLKAPRCREMRYALWCLGRRRSMGLPAVRSM